jgi:S1-C subfamily serine protease
MTKKAKFIGVAIFIVIGIIIGLSLSSNLDIQVNSNATVKEVPGSSAEFLDKLGTALSEISEAVKPAIVNISTEKTVKMRNTPFDHFFDDPFISLMILFSSGSSVTGVDNSAVLRNISQSPWDQASL